VNSSEPAAMAASSLTGRSTRRTLIFPTAQQTVNAYVEVAQQFLCHRTGSDPEAVSRALERSRYAHITLIILESTCQSA